MSGRDQGGRSGGLRLLSRLLSRREWAYVLALLVPFVGLNLALKASRASALGSGGAGYTGFLAPDLLFCAGYALLWVGLFAAFRSGWGRWCVVVLFHASAVVVALLTVAAYRFFAVTGSRLDLDTVLYFLSSPGEVAPVVASEASPVLFAAVAAALLYALLGPGLLAWAVGGGGSSRPNPRPTWRAPAVAGLWALVFVSLSALVGAARGPSDGMLSGSPPVELVAAEVGHLGAARTYGVDAARVRENLPTATSLKPTPGAEKRNVVLISLESTRARSVTPYNRNLKTTPFLDGLSGESILAERAYAVTPHTTNALTATVCGIDPPDREETESLGDRIPSRCLPELLDDQGYKSAFFQSVKEDFERRPQVAKNMGYEDFYSLEDMNTTGFERANYFGYEDDAMLGPSREWLEQNGEKPFFATYNTITPHHQYLAPEGRHGRKDFAEDDQLNRYQNSVRYLDFFVENLIRQYKEMGLYEDTVFVIQGDHGEAFGEHGRYQHDNVIWEEGIRIPLMVLDPSRPASRVKAPVNQLDVLPTVADLLGYRIEGGEYPGRSIVDPLPEDRAIKASCWYENECVASVKGDEKYVYHYGARPEELYDLSEDPSEKNNVAADAPPGYLKARREELLRWRAEVEAAYGEGPGS
ncbi:sulfatase-like hydrolase/transferase (plasmid) [Rubrobacter tropicus]|uniref:Sulfatase-like hydrolase/transferase n=1 Tax=Rubrobacter tropicus TaxID=2653851 RepID=A0A6G8QFT6_9ACTN|nr:sulfatase-like hydrolase/transferase [Rubrobacter tropicus]QIN85364.1 sulfatase-like hydrolase/transferase [Rubrobacter tropicus]